MGLIGCQGQTSVITFWRDGLKGICNYHTFLSALLPPVVLTAHSASTLEYILDLSA